MAERAGHGSQETQQRTFRPKRQTRNRRERAAKTSRLPSQV